MNEEAHHHKPKHRARSLKFTFKVGKIEITGDKMQTTLVSGQTESVVGSPVDANGNPSLAVLSNAPLYVSSDSTVFTIAPDSSTPNGAIITAVGAGSATLTETATATEADGTTEVIQGVATVVVTAVAPPPPLPAAALIFDFGTPTSSASKKFK